MTRGAVDADTLSRAVRAHLDVDVSVHDLRRLSGGASRETWSFTVEHDDGGLERLVLRRDPPGSDDSSPGHRLDEYALLQAVAREGVPVAPLRFRLEPDDELGRGFVMGHVDGETLGRRIVHDDAHATARGRFARRCGEILARIHAVPIDATPLRAPDDASSATLGQITQFEQLLDGFDVARPVLELGLRWLRENAPERERRSLVHGDFRVGNLVVDPTGVAAVLDWELAHVGDPAEDLGWLCVRSWRFGGEGRVGGCGDLDDLLAAYAAAGGDALTADDIRYWEVHGNVRWGVICLVQAFQHLTGGRRSVELAAIGRRLCEVEHDVMELLA